MNLPHLSVKRLQLGLSLVELMIAMLLGLLLTAGVIQIFLSSKQTYSVVTAQSHAQENGRLSAFFLSRSLRHAGFWSFPDFDPPIPKTFVAQGNFAADSVVWGADDDVVDAAVVDDTDVVQVRYNGASDGSILSCIGQIITESQVAVDRYYVGAPGAGVTMPNLMCQSTVFTKSAVDSSLSAPTANPPQPLIGGIENMQILYGVGPARGQVTQYVNASAVSKWDKVFSVRFATLATSDEETSGFRNDQSYTLLDKTVAAANDRRPRQVFVETVALRNVQ